MTKSLAAVSAAVFLALGLSATPSAAAPTAGPAGVERPESGLEQVRMKRRGRYHRRHMRRNYYSGSRAYAPSQSGNARNPERPPALQNQGGTTGGPRY